MSQGDRHKYNGAKVSTISALYIGIGGMLGGGILAVTGLTVELTKGAQG